ncbi:MAG: hypothetical protein K2R98_00240 [Gemmataceae bacterium]|nr:hypothetical protein [Gemmataceae bacterium]
MPSVRKLSPAEFKRFVKMLAHGFAAEWYKHRHGVDDDTAWLYAASFWRAHVDQVLDFLALRASVIT